MDFIKRLGWVVLVAMIMAIPVVIITSPSINAPIWYLILSYLAMTLGSSIFAILLGAITLIFFKKRSDKGLRASIIVVAIVSIILSYTSWETWRMTSQSQPLDFSKYGTPVEEK